MTWSNQTIVNGFILTGFSNLGKLQTLLFVAFLMAYLIAVMGNGLIVLLTSIDPTLHTPMYFFLQNLALAELGFISDIVPKALVNLLSEKKTISFLGCRAQVYFVFFFVPTECFLLVVMAYDRYVAICNPLRYTVIMNRKLCRLLVMTGWVTSIPIGIIQSTWVLSFPFCGSKIINHYFCDVPPILYLACADTLGFELYTAVCASIYLLGGFILILVSYIYIAGTILRIPSAVGIRKAFSTCSSHIIVVSLFFSSNTLTHFRPKPTSSPGNRYLLTLSYVVFTPMLNPVIYSLRNKEVKGALSRLMRKKMY